MESPHQSYHDELHNRTMTKKRCLKFFVRGDELRKERYLQSLRLNSEIMVSTCLLLIYVISTTSALSPKRQLRPMCPAFVQSKLDVSVSPQSIEIELATATGTNNYFCKKNKISRKIITRTIITRNARFPLSAEKVPKHKISSTELNLKFKTFDEMLEHHAEVPLLINFYASFCGPCKVSSFLLFFPPFLFSVVSIHEFNHCNY